MRILVVEDYGPLRGPVVMALRDEGWNVDVSGDGDGALKALEEQEHDLVILDLMIPGVDGLNVLQRCRAAGNFGRITGFSLIARSIRSISSIDNARPLAFDCSRLSDFRRRFRGL